MHPVRQTRPNTPVRLAAAPAWWARATTSRPATLAVTTATVAAYTATLALLPAAVVYALAGLASFLTAAVAVTAARRWPHRVPHAALALAATVAALGVGWFLLTYWRPLLLGAAVIAATVLALASKAGRCRCR